MKKIRLGLVRCSDIHGYYYGVMLADCDPMRLLEKYYIVHYYASNIYDPRKLTMPHVEGFDLVNVWDYDVNRTKTFAQVFLNKPRVCENLVDVAEGVDAVFISNGERDGSDETANDREGRGSGGRCAEECDCRNSCCGTASHAIVERDHLGHIGHGNAFCSKEAKTPADNNRNCYQSNIGEVGGQERDKCRDQHRSAGPDDPAPGRKRVAHPLHANDEEKDGHDVDRFDSKREIDHLMHPFLASSRCGRTSGGSAR